jgi:hypothetical protein
MLTPKQIKNMSDEDRQAIRLKKMIEYIDEILLLYYEFGKGVDIVLGSQPDDWGLELFKEVTKYYQTDWLVKDYIDRDLSFGIILSDPEDGYISPKDIIYVEGITRKNDPFKYFRDPASQFSLMSAPVDE